MASGNKAPFHRFDPGINGKQYEETHEDILGKIERIEKSWPEDSFGAKLSLGANYGYLLENMGQGDIDMMTNGEPIDPPRDPQPGTREFGEQARTRGGLGRRDREAVQYHDVRYYKVDKKTGKKTEVPPPSRGDYGRPEDPEDVEVTDVSGGGKTSLKKRRKALEDAGNF